MQKRTKRQAPKPPTLETDIYVSKTSNIPAQIKRINDLVGQRKPVIIHGLGIAIVNAVQLALRYKQDHPNVEWTIETSSVKLVDDVEGDIDDPITVATRTNSAIHIHLHLP